MWMASRRVPNTVAGAPLLSLAGDVLSGCAWRLVRVPAVQMGKCERIYKSIGNQALLVALLVV